MPTFGYSIGMDTMTMSVGTNHAFAFDDPPAPPPARPLVSPPKVAKPVAKPVPAAEPSPATVAVVAPLPGARMTWTGTAHPLGSLRDNITCWETIFGSRWRDYLNSALEARDAGVQADAAIDSIAARATHHYPLTISALLLGAGVARSTSHPDYLRTASAAR